MTTLNPKPNRRVTALNPKRKRRVAAAKDTARPSRQLTPELRSLAVKAILAAPET